MAPVVAAHPADRFRFRDTASRLVVLGLDDAEAAAGSQDGGEHGGADEDLPERHLRRG